jgi:hypothetical protein
MKMSKLLTPPTLAVMSLMGIITLVDSLFMLENPIEKMDGFQFRVCCYCIVSALTGVGLFIFESRKQPKSDSEAT